MSLIQFPVFRRLALCLAVVLPHCATCVMASSHLIYFGTYTKNGSQGIYATRLDDASGVLSTPQLVAQTPNPTWVVASPDRQRLYTVHPSKAQVVGYRVNPATAALTPLPRSSATNEPAGAPCHLAIDPSGRALVAANYGAGFVASVPVHADGTTGTPAIIAHTGRGPDPKRQDKPHVHSVTFSPDHRFVIVCDLGLDRVFTYTIDAATATLTPASPAFVATAPGTGPRHFAFGRDGRHAYCLTEMGSTIVTFDYDSARGALTPTQSLSTVPEDYPGLKWSAEVRVHPNGRFLYCSNREHDSLAVFAIDAATGQLTRVEIVPSGGKVPRNFALSPDGRWLICAHQESEYVTVFQVDPSTGRLTPTPHRAKVPSAVCVLFH